MQQPPERSERQSGEHSGAFEQLDKNGDRTADSLINLRAIKHDWSTTGTLVLSTLLGSMLIVLYVLTVNQYKTRKETDVVERAALAAAQELTFVTVDSPSFGRIGLCDLPPGSFLSAHGPSSGATGLNRLYQTLDIDETVADRLHLPLMKKMVRKDRDAAHKAEHELIAKLQQAIQSDTAQSNVRNLPTSGQMTEDQDNSVYRDAYRIISSGREAQSSAAVEVHISLGRAQPDILDRDTVPRTVQGGQFIASDQEHAPYLVQIAVTYERHGKTDSAVTVTAKPHAVALIAAPDVQPPPCAFVLSFPSGVPPQFKSAHDLLFYKGWQGSGDWQQAVGSEVPGKGSLAPPLEPIIPEMPAGDAMSVALYHWLRCAGPAVDPDRVVELVNSRWDLAPLAVARGHAQDMSENAEHPQALANSCLVHDTGAREYSIMNQTAPGSVGQLALCRALNVYDPNNQALAQPVYPPSALPLFIDQEGKCNLSGRNKFDAALVRDYLHTLYATNLAAIDSLAVAKQMTSQANNALNLTDQKIFIEKQELASVTNRLGNLSKQVTERPSLGIPRSAGSSDDPKRILELVNERLATLKQSLKSYELQHNRYERILRLATQTMLNASREANATYDLCAHSFKLCRDGIFRIDAPVQGFVIGKHLLFVPQTRPATESDFFDEPPHGAAAQPNGSAEVTPADEAALSPWLQKNMQCIFSVESSINAHRDDIKVEGRSLKEYAQAQFKPAQVPVGMVVLDSRLIEQGAANAQTNCTVYREYPFANIPIPSGQLLYYSQNALETGGSPSVSWSVLLRDLVASRSSDIAEGAAGKPIASQERDWCKHVEHSTCPGLACELQIRCPLPVVNKMIEDASLKNPSTNAQIPEIPPAPADML